MTARFDRNRLDEAIRQASTTRRVVAEAGALGDVGRLFGSAFADRPALIVADEMTFAVAGQTVQAALQAAGVRLVEALIFPGTPALKADYAHVGTIRAALSAGSDGVIPIAVGSGTINDLTKRAAFEADRPYMVVGTAASMDGYTASGAALVKDGFKQTLECPAPVLVVTDLDVVRRAPAAMTASGYGDLVGKITAGADWLVANVFGIEPIQPEIWTMVQEPLRPAIADPDALRGGDAVAIEQLFLGLTITGLAMQAEGSSRPAAGSEHQFSHLWEMRGLTHNGRTVSHGFKVALGTLFSTVLYERLLDYDAVDIDWQGAVERWPDLATLEDDVRQTQREPMVMEQALMEVRAKYIGRDELRRRVAAARQEWPDLTKRLREQLLPSSELRDLLRAGGCPVTPEEIGLTRADLRESYRAARQVRRRYTVLDLVNELGLHDDLVRDLFAAGGAWGDASDGRAAAMNGR